MERRRAEDRRLDDWTQQVDERFAVVAEVQQRMAVQQTGMRGDVTAVRTELAELRGEVQRLRSLPVLSMTPVQQSDLADMAAERAAQKVIDRRQELLGKRWQRWATVATVVCTPLSVILTVIALAVTGHLP